LWVLVDLVDGVHGVIALYGYNSGGAAMTLVLPLGFFIVVMIVLYFVFSRPHGPGTSADQRRPAGRGRSCSSIIDRGGGQHAHRDWGGRD
jgi:hypothetical protein